MVLEQKRFSGEREEEAMEKELKWVSVLLEAGLAGIQAVTSALKGASGAFETRPRGCFGAALDFLFVGSVSCVSGTAHQVCMMSYC